MEFIAAVVFAVCNKNYYTNNYPADDSVRSANFLYNLD